MNRTIRTFLLLGLLLGSMTTPLSLQALPDGNTIDFTNCTLTLPGTTGTAPARCGWLEVPENPADPEGRQIDLHIALAPAVSRTASPDPLFFLAGGPGQSATESWVIMRPVLEKIRKDRDIVLVDQRGTGKSSPMKCPLEEGDVFETRVDLELIREQTRKCLAGQEGDPRFYTTTIAIQDIDRVREAMGYETINLLGISYGTRAAQVYLRHFQDHVRAVILDSVVPMELALGQEHGRMLDRAVAEIFADCNADDACNARFSTGAGALDTFVQDLRRQPREITFTHPYTGEQDTLEVTADVLAFAIRFLSYDTHTQAVLPLLVNEAVGAGRLDRLATQAMLIGGALSEQISRGMELSVICSEDYPFMQDTGEAADTLLGDTLLKTLQTACGVWPRGAIPDDFHTPVSAPVPVLLLAGDRDPVTPPAYARQAAAHFPRSMVLVAPGQGHSVSSHPCLRDISAAFINSGTLDGLDTGCVNRIEPAPFFTSILGPDP